MKKRGGCLICLFVSGGLTKMSRSKRKTSIAGAAGCSEKQDKRLYNRRYRQAFKQHLRNRTDNDAWPHLHDYSDPWGMAKDGRSWFDGREFPELMRK